MSDNTPITVDMNKWAQDGYLHLPQFYSHEFIDTIIENIDRFRAEAGDEAYDPSGRPNRVLHVHAGSAGIQKALLNPRLNHVLSQLFSAKPVLWGSLLFDQGSEQIAHTDAPWFFVEPYGSMAGVWTALEDVHEDSGPLFLVPGSHKSALDVEAALKKNPELHAEVLAFRAKNLSASTDPACWDLSKRVAEQCQLEWTNREGRQKFCIKKGDVVIWHQWMVHGGSPVNDPVRTRQSLISHWTANNSVAFDQHNYFLNYGRLDDKLAMPLPVQDTTDGCYLKQKSHIISWVPPETFINTVETA